MSRDFLEILLAFMPPDTHPELAEVIALHREIARRTRQKIENEGVDVTLAAFRQAKVEWRLVVERLRRG